MVSSWPVYLQFLYFPRLPSTANFQGPQIAVPCILPSFITAFSVMNGMEQAGSISPRSRTPIYLFILFSLSMPKTHRNQQVGTQILMA